MGLTVGVIFFAAVEAFFRLLDYEMIERSLLVGLVISLVCGVFIALFIFCIARAVYVGKLAEFAVYSDLTQFHPGESIITQVDRRIKEDTMNAAMGTRRTEKSQMCCITRFLARFQIWDDIRPLWILILFLAITFTIAIFWISTLLGVWQIP